MQSHEAFMALAIEQACLAESKGEVPIGAIIIHENKIIASAHNGPITQKDPSAHAEIQAMRQAGPTLGNYRLLHCQLYVTLEPCLMCVGAMVHARIEQVIFAASDPKAGCMGSVCEAHNMSHLNHRIKVTGGILSSECSELLQAFFRKRR